MISIILHMIIPILVVIAIVGLWLAGSYNMLVRFRNRVKESWSDIAIQLKRRHDLIPNLVETVKGYAAHESNVLEEVIKARTNAVTAGSLNEKAQAENQLTGALKQLFALAEAYPNLRASENFAKLQDELTDTENKIQAARRFYNSNVLHYNTALEQFPTNIIAAWFDFMRDEYFQLDNPSEAAPVQVKF
ncbi:LemA family protein [Candidatus Parcubacteria bacterium]|nr:LemA family protein [Candidatus Parcubacteria bacterium]